MVVSVPAQEVITKCESLLGGAARMQESGVSLTVSKGDVPDRTGGGD